MAFPTYQASGTFVASAAANVSPAWPAHAAGDIGLLVVETMGYNYAPIIANRTGWKEVPASPRGSAVKESSGSNSSTSLTVYWKRATSGAEAAPEVKFIADHIHAGIVTVRGCAAAGNPFTGATGISSGHAVAAATIPIPGLTTTTADQLIVAIGATGINNASANRFTGMANASLANITEQTEKLSTTGGGSQVGIYTGEKAAAGAINASVITPAASSPNNGIVIAFTAVEQSDDDTPWVANVGDQVKDTTATLTVPWPEHMTGDIGLLFIESDDWPVTLATPAGFVEVPDSPQTAGSGGTSTAAALSVFWCRATSGAMASPVITKPDDHLSARMMVVRGCVPTGNPWDVTAGNNNNGSAGTSVSVPGDTTTVPETLIVAAATHSTDSLTAFFDGWANAGLDNLIERFDESHTFSFGGGLAGAVGRKPVAGSFGSTTATIGTSSHQGRIMLALKAATAALRELLGDHGVFTISGQDGSMTKDMLFLGDHGVFALTGQDADLGIMFSYSINGDPGMFSIIGQPATMQKQFGRWRKQAPPGASIWRYQEPPD